jgi:nickel-dependent lactate racemase
MPPERVLGVWNGPRGVSSDALAQKLKAVLRSPIAYPRLAEAVVPGDRVVLALDPAAQQWPLVVRGLVDELATGSVGPELVRAVTRRPLSEAERDDAAIIEGMLWTTHDLSEREHLAYLATTKSGRRVYLNRHLVEADVVVAIGPMGYDEAGRETAPSDVIDPGLSDVPERGAERGDSVSREENMDWLLGSRFHVAVIAGVGGPAEILAGDATAVRVEGVKRLRKLWRFEADARAEVAVLGIGLPSQAVGWETLARALKHARRLVKRGGTIVVLSELAAPPGPLVARLAESNDLIEEYREIERRAEFDDWQVARELVHAVKGGKVYLASRLDEAIVEGLNIISLGKPAEAARLVERSESCVFVSQADWTEVTAPSEGRR